MFPVHPKVSILSRFQVGAISGKNIPLTYKFFLGGVDSFLGLKYQERMGDFLQAALIGIQFEPWLNRFILLRWNIGNTSDRWKNLFIRNRAITGFGATAGLSTPLGPIELTMMGGSWNNFMVYFNIGYKF